MTWSSVLRAALACVVLSACGRDATPVSPGASPPPSATGISISSGADALRTGTFADFRVTAVMSDGTTQTVTSQAAVHTSDPSIATVDANGRVTALNHGQMTLSASYQGRTAARRISVVHNYGGEWSGTYTVRSCAQDGVFASAHYCQNLSREPARFSLELTQGGPDVDDIGGRASLNGLVGSIGGKVRSDGRLILSGAYVAVQGGVDFRVEILNWVTEPAGSLGMAGEFTVGLTLLGASGAASQVNQILTATRTKSPTFADSP